MVGHGEFGEPFDLVPPQVDANGRIGGARVDVDNRAAHRHLTAMFDLSLPAVAKHDELFDERDRVDLIARTHLDGVDGGMRVDSLDQRSRGRHNERRRTVGCEPVEHGQALTHRLDTRADAFERQRLPGGKVQHLVVPQDRRSIGGETLGFGLRRGSDQYGATIRRSHKAGDDERPARVGDGDHRFAPAEGGVDRGFFAELVEQIAERGHGTRRTHRGSFSRIGGGSAVVAVHRRLDIADSEILEGVGSVGHDLLQHRTVGA